MEPTKGYPKYQYSIFMKNGRDPQLVVRADDFEEFKTLITNIQYMDHEVKVAGAQQVADQLICEGHKLPMKLNKNGKPYHMDRSRPEGDQFCNGYGFPNEKRSR